MESTPNKTVVAAIVFVAAVASCIALFVVAPWRDRVVEDALRDELQQAVEQVRQAHEFANEQQRCAFEDYASYLGVRLREHDARLEIARRDLRDEIASYFDSRKEHVGAFASDATSLKMKWTGIWDSEEHRESVRALFNWHVISIDEMTEELERDVERFLTTVQAEEDALMQDVREKLIELPRLEVRAALDETAFRALVAARVDKLANELSTSARTEMVAFALSFTFIFTPTFAKVLDVVAHTGAAGPAIVRWLLDGVAERVAALATSPDTIEASAMRTLDELKYVLMDGSEQAWADYRALEDVADSADEGERERARDIMARMRGKGYLGLDEVFRMVQERSMAAKRQVLPLVGVPD